MKMRCRDVLTAMLVVAFVALSPAAAYTTDQCREVSRCDVDGTLVYAFSGECVCCPEMPTGDILPVQCVPSTAHCPSVPSCRACDTTPGMCDTCMTGYVLEPANICNECLASMCDVCQSGSEGKRCQLCSEGYYWMTGGECHPVSNSQDSESNTQCRVAFCSTCPSTTASSCIKCNDGYAKDSNGFCVSACSVQQCDMCYTGNSADCQLCSAGNTWSATGCSVGASGCRVGHCTTCVAGDNTNCAICESEYTLTAGYCLPQQLCTDANCASCPSDAGTCAQCANGYGLVDGVCVRCEVPNCFSCDSDPSKCTQCAPNYYLTPLSTCSPVPCNIEHCMECDPQTPSRCQQCAAPYVVDSYDGLCRLPDACSVPNCKKCKTDTSRLCAECDAGYSLSADATSCSSPTTQPCEVEHCNTCVDGDSIRCAYCNTGYYVSDGKCKAMQDCYVSNCAQCMLLDSTKCSTCMKGYLLTSSYGCVPQRVINGAAAPYSLWVPAVVLLASVATHLA